MKDFESVALLIDIMRALLDAINTMKALLDAIEVVVEAIETYIANSTFCDIRFLYRNELLYYIDDNDYERLCIFELIKVKIFN